MDKSSNKLYTFSRLEEIASFLLYEAFKYAHSAAEYEVAGLIFGDRTMSIEPEPGWNPPARQEALVDWFQQRGKEDQGDDDVTISRLAEVWHLSLTEAASSDRKLLKTHKFISTDMVGYIINLSACVETVINRHLFHLRESGTLENHLYNSMDKAGILPKVLFAFKDEILSGKISVARLRYLVTLRNNAVHYREASVDAVTPSSEELLGIWREVSDLFGLIEGEPSMEQVELWSKEFEHKWLQHS
jgi:hypothetical protein